MSIFFEQSTSNLQLTTALVNLAEGLLYFHLQVAHNGMVLNVDQNQSDVFKSNATAFAGMLMTRATCYLGGIAHNRRFFFSVNHIVSFPGKGHRRLLHAATRLSRIRAATIIAGYRDNPLKNVSVAWLQVAIVDRQDAMLFTTTYSSLRENGPAAVYQRQISN